MLPTFESPLFEIARVSVRVELCIQEAETFNSSFKLGKVSCFAWMDAGAFIIVPSWIFEWQLQTVAMRIWPAETASLAAGPSCATANYAAIQRLIQRQDTIC